MCAAYVSGGTIVLGKNEMRTDPKSNARGNRIHAEQSVLRGVDKAEGKVFVYREDRWGTPKYARPCPHCLTLLKSKGCKKVVYSTESGFCEERI